MPSLEDIEAQKDLLEQHRRTLSVYLAQVAVQGIGHVAPGVVNGIADTRASIRTIKEYLRA